MAADIKDVAEIYETHHEKYVNAYLKAGWTLIDTASGAWSDTGEPYIKYVLGWAQDREVVRPKIDH